MNKIIFTEEFCQPENLFPFTLTRQLQDIRVGILTIREKWERYLGLPSFDKKEDDYKDLARSVNIDEALSKGESCYIIHGNVLPTKSLVKAVRSLRPGEFIASESGPGIAFCISSAEIIDRYKIRVGKAITIKQPVKCIQYPWDIFQLNAWAIEQDFELLSQNRNSAALSKTNNVVKRSKIFIEKGASVEYSTINGSDGPVYIGRNTVVMEGSLLRGPIAICQGSIVKMGTRIYGATTLGPGTVAGGEIKNSVVFGNSNKAHDGYLGDSVIGEWCNLGAGTTNSNLKNNASDVRIWTPSGELKAGRKCGVIMGDYSRTAINTSINTGTVVGVCCNVFGNGLTPKYIPNFSWGSEGVKRYEFDKSLEDINGWKELKGQALTADEQSILSYIYDKFL